MVKTFRAAAGPPGCGRHGDEEAGAAALQQAKRCLSGRQMRGTCDKLMQARAERHLLIRPADKMVAPASHCLVALHQSSVVIVFGGNRRIRGSTGEAYAMQCQR
jgi:hypothetical protein